MHEVLTRRSDHPIPAVIEINGPTRSPVDFVATAVALVAEIDQGAKHLPVGFDRGWVR
jgi:hypothetical protein